MLHLYITIPTFTNSPLSYSSLPGNVKFDPLSLAEKDFTLNGIMSKSTRNPSEILYDYSEAEIKHGRLAMLAAIAYPVQETVNPVLSKALHLPNELVDSNLSPSLLNGNLSPSILILFLGFGSGIELYKINSLNENLDLPADYLWRFTDEKVGSDGFINLQEGEVWNGRIAMMSVLGYIVQEYVTKMPVLLNV